MLGWAPSPIPIDLRGPPRRESLHQPGLSTSSVLEAASSHFTPIKSPKLKKQIPSPKALSKSARSKPHESRFKKSRRSNSVRAPAFPPALPKPPTIVSHGGNDFLEKLGGSNNGRIHFKIDNFTVFNQFNTNNSSGGEAGSPGSAPASPRPRGQCKPQASDALRSPNDETVVRLIQQYRR